LHVVVKRINGSANSPQTNALTTQNNTKFKKQQQQQQHRAVSERDVNLLAAADDN